MKLSKCLKLALNILFYSKLRSWLTIVGIVIGVAAVVAIVSADLITISPGKERASGGFRGFGGGDMNGNSAAQSASTKNLTKRDVQNLQSIQNIAVIGGFVSGKGEVYYLSEKSTVSIDGVDPLVWKELTSSEIESGRVLNPADYNVIIVGSRIAQKTFKQPLALNRILTIEGKPFKIVGILKESGSPGSDDNKLIMPIDAARDTLTNVGSDSFNSIIIKASSVDAVDALVADADAKLTISRHLTEKRKDFKINSAKATQERLSGITQTMTLFLGAIAAVSLVVGAVGIANTMFTSVLEKTRDIGIMKAIGAKNKDILTIFITNAGMVGMVGGIIGVIIGFIISKMIPKLGLQLIGPGGGAMNTVVTPQLIILALLLSLFIGVIAGAIPAYRASKLKPVDALRYE